MKVYQIVHVRSDGSEHVITEVENPSYIKSAVDTAEYQGTWLSDTVKLLRFKRGQIIVRVVESDILPRSSDPEVREIDIIDKEIVNWKKFEALKLKVINGGNLHWLMLTPSQIIAYDANNIPLWSCNSFNELGEMLSKRIAFIALQLHEEYVKAYDYRGAM